MLVLSSKVDESVMIGITPGVEVEVKVCEIRGNKVRLGFVLPREFPVLRKDIYDSNGGFHTSDYDIASRKEHRVDDQ